MTSTRNDFKNLTLVLLYQGDLHWVQKHEAHPNEVVHNEGLVPNVICHCRNCRITLSENHVTAHNKSVASMTFPLGERGEQKRNVSEI